MEALGSAARRAHRHERRTATAACASSTAIPARGLIGFQGEFLTLTRGTGLISHIFDGYAPVKGDIPDRHNGVLISNENGEAVAYALFNLQERGRMFVSPGEKLYEGMIIGIHSRDNDLVVNPIKTKKLTNIRAAGKDDAILLTPPIQLTLEYAVEFIADDELVEVTPEVDPHPQALPEGTRAQARLAQRCRADRVASAGAERHARLAKALARHRRPSPSSCFVLPVRTVVRCKLPLPLVSVAPSPPRSHTQRRGRFDR